MSLVAKRLPISATAEHFSILPFAVMHRVARVRQRQLILDTYTNLSRLALKERRYSFKLPGYKCNLMMQAFYYCEHCMSCVSLIIMAGPVLEL